MAPSLSLYRDDDFYIRFQGWMEVCVRNACVTAHGLERHDRIGRWRPRTDVTSFCEHYMHRGMCRAIFLRHSFHNIVFSSFFFLFPLLPLLFFSPVFTVFTRLSPWRARYVFRRIPNRRIEFPSTMTLFLILPLLDSRISLPPPLFICPFEILFKAELS